MWSADRRERAAAALKARIEQAQAARRQLRRQRRYQRQLARNRRKTAARREAAEQQARQQAVAQRELAKQQAAERKAAARLLRQQTAEQREVDAKPARQRAAPVERKAERKADAAKARAVRQYASVLRPSCDRERKPNPAYAVWATERCWTCDGAGTLLSGQPCPCVLGRIARRSAERYCASPPCAWRIEFAWCVRRAGVPAEWHMVRLHGQTRPQAWWLRQGGRNRMRRWDIAVGREILAAGITLPHV